MKSGWKTSEFWLAIAASVLIYIFPDAPKEPFLAVIGYILSRGIAKVGKAK